MFFHLGNLLSFSAAFPTSFSKGREGQMPLREGGGGGGGHDIGTVSIKEEDRVGSSSEA